MKVFNQDIGDGQYYVVLNPRNKDKILNKLIKHSANEYVARTFNNLIIGGHGKVAEQLATRNTVGISLRVVQDKITSVGYSSIHYYKTHPDYVELHMDIIVSMEHLFERFLKINRVYTKYNKNLESSAFDLPIRLGGIIEMQRAHEPRRWLMDSFAWEESPQGGTFWGELHSKWIRVHDKFNKQVGEKQ